MGEDEDTRRTALIDAFAVLRARPPHLAGRPLAAAERRRLERSVPPAAPGPLREVGVIEGMDLDLAMRVYLDWIDALPRDYAWSVHNFFCNVVHRELGEPLRLYGLLVEVVGGTLVREDEG